MKAKKSLHVDMKESTTWLRHGNNSPQDEAVMCYLQDRNVFFGESRGVCTYCKERARSVDHLATQCDRMMDYDYTWRHNEVVRSIHLGFCTKYGIKRCRRLRSHRVESTVENSRVCIRTDTPIVTSTGVRANRPDIVVHDKVRNEITIVEVGITSQNNLQEVEIEKTRKYGLLAGELAHMYKCKVDIIPYVMTWEGVVTKHHRKYRKALGIERHVEAYIQSQVLKRTFVSAIASLQPVATGIGMCRRDAVRVEAAKLHDRCEAHQKTLESRA